MQQRAGNPDSFLSEQENLCKTKPHLTNQGSIRKTDYVTYSFLKVIRSLPDINLHFSNGNYEISLSLNPMTMHTSYPIVQIIKHVHQVGGRSSGNRYGKSRTCFIDIQWIFPHFCIKLPSVSK